LESFLNGATGVTRVRSSSAFGLSVVWVEFDWGSDVYRDRQVVSERLQLARARLPEGTDPVLAPVSSILGEVLIVGLRPAGDPGPAEERTRQALELRTLADFTLANRLRPVEGVSQVTVLGGVVKQYQVVTSPGRLAAQGVTLQQLTEAAAKADAVAG